MQKHIDGILRSELPTPANQWLTVTEEPHQARGPLNEDAGVLPYFDQETGLPTLVGVPGETGHFAEQREYIGGKREAFERSLMLVSCYLKATGRDRVLSGGVCVGSAQSRLARNCV